MLIALGGIAMSFFYTLNHCQSSKKPCTTRFCKLENTIVERFYSHSQNWQSTA